MSAHTPGPWRVVEGHANCAHIEKPFGSVESADWTICDVYADVEELAAAAPANARLISAAPELLAALKAALPFIDDADDVQKFFPSSAASAACRAAAAAAHAAIAKAEGGH